MAWNLTKHANNEIPHLHRFGTPPGIFVLGLDTTVHQLHALQELLRVKTDRLRIINLLKPLLNPYRWYDSIRRTFTTNQYVWFHRRNHGCCRGLVQFIETPMFPVRFVNRVYPTQKALFHPYFEDYATPRDTIPQQ